MGWPRAVVVNLGTSLKRSMSRATAARPVSHAVDLVCSPVFPAAPPTGLRSFTRDLSSCRSGANATRRGYSTGSVVICTTP